MRLRSRCMGRVEKSIRNVPPRPEKINHNDMWQGIFKVFRWPQVQSQTTPSGGYPVQGRKSALARYGPHGTQRLRYKTGSTEGSGMDKTAALNNKHGARVHQTRGTHTLLSIPTRTPCAGDEMMCSLWLILVPPKRGMLIHGYY